MSVTVQGPDNRIYEFPDGTDKAAAIAYFRRKGIGISHTDTSQGGQERIHPEARTVGSYLKEGLFGTGRGLRNDVTGLYQTIFHPIETASGLVSQAGEAAKAANKEFRETKGAPLYQRGVSAALSGLESAPIVGGMVEKAEQGGGHMASPEALGAALEGITTFAAPDMLGRGVAKALKGAPEMARASLKSSVISPADIREAAQETVEANKNAAEKHLEAAREAVNKQKEARAKAIEKRRGEEAEHKQERKEAAEHNQRVLEERKARSETKAKLEESSKELRARIETAREKALKEGNDKYNTVNEALDPLAADEEAIAEGVGEAMQKIKGSDTEPAIIKSMFENSSTGEGITYRDLQGYYSELNRELTKGTLPGDVYAALDTLHDAIGKEMQRIADSRNMGQQLNAARTYWRRMKQTFGKPLNATDVATQTMGRISPEFVKSEELANRVRLLGNFDKRIPVLAENIGNLEKGLDALGKEKPLRELLKRNPPPLPPARIPKMEEAEVPERPLEKKLSPETLRTMEKEKIQQKGRDIQRQKTGRTVATGVTSPFAIFELMRGHLGYTAALIAARILYGMGERGLGRLLENPAVADWLSRPTEKDISVIRKLTPQQQAVFGDSLRPLLEQAERNKVKVDPQLLRIAGMTATGAALAGNAKRRVASALSAGAQERGNF